MTPNEWRRSLAWAITHAEARSTWQLEVYAKVGGLASRREDDAELMAVYADIGETGPCNWSWHNGYGHPSTAAILGREPARGERVIDTFNLWLRTPAEHWPDVLPVPEVSP
jgi:hypothetical protein